MGSYRVPFEFQIQKHTELVLQFQYQLLDLKCWSIQLYVGSLHHPSLCPYLESENFDIKLLGEERRVSPGLSELEIWSREAVGESPMETMEFGGIHGSDKGG